MVHQIRGHWLVSPQKGETMLCSRQRVASYRDPVLRDWHSRQLHSSLSLSLPYQSNNERGTNKYFNSKYSHYIWPSALCIGLKYKKLMKKYLTFSIQSKVSQLLLINYLSRAILIVYYFWMFRFRTRVRILLWHIILPSGNGCRASFG